MVQILWTVLMYSCRMSRLKVSNDLTCPLLTIATGILMIGEIGGSAEENAANYLKQHNTVIFIVKGLSIILSLGTQC